MFFCPPDGKRLRGEQDALDLIGECGRDASLIVIPVARLDEDFFRLKTGVAGAMLQKFMTYGKRIAVVGDISRYRDESSAFRDFVVECNRGSFLRFFEDRQELESHPFAQVK